mgnify:CR=1 FL=1
MKKAILITGGSQRIGRSIALFLKDSNYNFIIHYNCLLYTSDAADE